ncbi:unnamed protein product [Scytosiphon promiscuus]
MQASMDSETVRERLEDLGEELNTVASLVHLSIKNQQQEGVDEAAGAFDCSGDAERKFQDLKGEVQTLARVLDSNSSSLASLTADSLSDVNRLADQAARCKSAIGALDGLCQASPRLGNLLTSSQLLLAKNEYVQASDAVASAEILLGDLQQAEAGSSPGRGNLRGRANAGVGVGKENRRDAAAPGAGGARRGSGNGDSGVLRALKRLLLKRRAGLENHLRDVVHEAVQLGPTTRCRKVFSGYLCDRYFRSPVPLVDVFEALRRLGQLDPLFADVSEKLRKEVIAPLLSSRYVPPPKRVSDAETASLTYSPATANGAASSEGEFSWKKQGEGVAGDAAGSAAGGLNEGPGAVSELLERVAVVLEFMHQEVLGGQGHLTAALGLRLLSDPEGLGEILLNKLEDHIPHSAQHLADFEKGARDACYDFENRLSVMGYYGDDGTVGSVSGRGSLSRFVETVDGRFAAKRRRTLLQQARDMALGDYHNTVEVSDALEGGVLSDPTGTAAAGMLPSQGSKKGGKSVDQKEAQTFRLEACQVSTVARSLVALVRATLTEACSDQVPPHCAKELFRTARDMLDLFRAVIPVQHANALDGVPRIAAVFQNDCLYLAHHMVTLGHEFRQGLPPPANQTATMIDTVPLFRELAAQSSQNNTISSSKVAALKILSARVESDDYRFTLEHIVSRSAQHRLYDAHSVGAAPFILPSCDLTLFLQPYEGMGRLWSLSPSTHALKCRTAYGMLFLARESGALQKLKINPLDYRSAWSNVLPDRVYKRVMGALLSLVAGKVCTPVLAAEDLGEEQTHALHRIFKTLGEAAQDIFDSSAEAEQHTPGWSKAVVVGQMMEFGLEAIGEQLQGDGLRPLSNDELGGLVRAIFQDNPGRSAILDAIGQGLA